MQSIADIEEADLERVIPTFYARVRGDDLIGPIFNEAIADWDHHLDLLIAFWSSVMRTSGRYKGNPVAAHLKHRARLDPSMFERWLGLWRDVTNDLLPGPQAAALQEKADRIGQSLQLALWFRVPDAHAGDQPAAPGVSS